MTERIYLSDPYLTALGATVLACEPSQDGFAVVLDRTICYPRGGGQPCEPATLNGQRVLDCFEEEGRILHILKAPAEGAVSIVIDGEARLDHMCQHTGEHVLSKVIEQRFGGKISILRIEADSSHIEIDRELTPEQLLLAQSESNRVIAQNLLVRSILASPQEAERRYGVPAAKAEAHETVRVVEIEGLDFNGCGGTHCRTTREVGELVIVGVKAVRGQFRIYFQCGGRAAREHARRLTTLLDMQAAFGVELLPELHEKALQTLERRNHLEAENRALRARMLELDTERLLLRAERRGERLFAAALLEEGDAKYIKAVCDAAVAQENLLALCAVKAGEHLSLIFARSKSKDQGPNLGALLKELAAAHGGKGGGSAVLAQGMMPDTPESRAAFETLAADERFQ